LQENEMFANIARFHGVGNLSSKRMHC